ncbi:MAG: hypothetical protein JWL77_2114 [Chthonomonadaceae bacterium]|nr:hypothetical protein [Chthonomonadaceae bacterium]
MKDYLRAGRLALRSASQGCFEILRLDTNHTGILVATGEVHKLPIPTLHIETPPPQERSLDIGAIAIDQMVLHTENGALPTDYELRAVCTEAGIEVVLSGHHRYRCFWWRVDFTVENDEVRVRGPILAPDCDS